MDLNSLQQMRMSGVLAPPSPEDDQDPLKRSQYFSGMFNGVDQPDEAPNPVTTGKRFFTGVLPQSAPPPPAVNKSAFDMPAPMGDDAVMSLMSQVYGNKGPAQSAYAAALKTQPQRDDPAYKPSMYRRISAGLVGFGTGVRNPAGAYDAASHVLDAPFEDATSDYQRRIKGLDEAAKLERGPAEDQLKAIMTARALGLNTAKFQASNQLGRDKLEQTGQIATAKQATANKRADAYIADKAAGKYKEVPQADGSILMVNEKNPADTQYVDADTVAAANTRIRARNATTGERNATTRAAGEASLAQDRTDRRAIARDKLAKSGQAKGLTPAGIQKATDNVLRAMTTDRRYGQYVKPGANGFFEFGEDDGTSDYQDFLDEVKKRIETNNPMGERKKGGSRVTIGEAQ